MFRRTRTKACFQPLQVAETYGMALDVRGRGRVRRLVHEGILSAIATIRIVRNVVRTLDAVRASLESGLSPLQWDLVETKSDTLV